jgi:hypothetical protein
MLKLIQQKSFVPIAELQLSKYYNNSKGWIMMKKCLACNTENELTTKFCVKCGSAIKQTENKTFTSSDVSPHLSNPTPAFTGLPNTFSKQNKVTKKHIMIILSIFVLIVTVFILIGRNSNLDGTVWILESIVVDGVTFSNQEFTELIDYTGEISLRFTSGNQVRYMLGESWAYYGRSANVSYTVNGNIITLHGTRDLNLIRNGNKITLTLIEDGSESTMIFIKQ